MTLIGKNYKDKVFGFLPEELKSIEESMNEKKDAIITDGKNVYMFNLVGLCSKHKQGQAKDVPTMLESWTRKAENFRTFREEQAERKPSFEPPKVKLEIGMNYEELQTTNTGVKNKVNVRMRDGLPSVVVTDEGVCEVSAEGVVTNIHKTSDPTERNGIITRITNVSGNNKDMPPVPSGEYYMYAHVLERVRDRFPHTKTWGMPAMVRYSIKQFCASKDQFCTTNGERYIIKGKMTFVVNYKGVIVTVITTTRDFVLYAQCWKETGERIPSWLVSKKAMNVREDIVIKFSPSKSGKGIE